MRFHSLITTFAGAVFVAASTGACHGPESDAAKTGAAHGATVRARTHTLASQAEAAESVGDFASARRALAELLRLDPSNLTARDALDRLSAPSEVAGSGLADPNAGALAASPFRPRAGRVVGPSPLGPLPPTTVSTNQVAVGTADGSRQGSAAGEVVASADTLAKANAARSRRARAAARSRALARPAVPRSEVATGPESNDSSDVADSAADASPKHKRTWPWTRFQRWLVAKGLVGGAGAGVVVGAIIGNVPGALIAGSAAGGAVGFKKATEVGPAAPYPTAKDSAEFSAKKAKEEREKRRRQADSAEAVAVRGP